MTIGLCLLGPDLQVGTRKDNWLNCFAVMHLNGQIASPLAIAASIMEVANWVQWLFQCHTSVLKVTIGTWSLLAGEVRPGRNRSRPEGSEGIKFRLVRRPEGPIERVWSSRVWWIGKNGRKGPDRVRVAVGHPKSQRGWGCENPRSCQRWLGRVRYCFWRRQARAEADEKRQVSEAGKGSCAYFVMLCFVLRNKWWWRKEQHIFCSPGGLKYKPTSTSQFSSTATGWLVTGMPGAQDVWLSYPWETSGGQAVGTVHYSFRSSPRICSVPAKC